MSSEAVPPDSSMPARPSAAPATPLDKVTAHPGIIYAEDIPPGIRALIHETITVRLTP